MFNNFISGLGEDIKCTLSLQTTPIVVLDVLKGGKAPQRDLEKLD